ncbi:hypothetical protein CGH27_26290, partial [Vibrio parahaemolyticus]|uniref:hypothetical protein n=1 Tax=Vibrio parahaemolyticus TaxID=670 RepID=UPI001175BB31
LKDESWLEEKRTEQLYFHLLQIRKGFGPRTSTTTPKVIKALSKATTKMKTRQRNRLRVRSRKR